jgi:hypothetical protein
MQFSEDVLHLPACGEKVVRNDPAVAVAIPIELV